MNWKYWGEPFAKAYMELEGKHRALRIASGIKRSFEASVFSMDLSNTIVGNRLERAVAGYHFGSGINVDYALGREFVENNKGTAEALEVQRILDYFEKEDTIRKIKESMTEEEKKRGYMRVFWAGEWGGHTLLDYKVLLEQGTTGLMQKIGVQLGRTVDKDETEWLESLRVICEAFNLYAEKYAELAHSMGQSELDIEKKKELAEIERICRKVPRFPAKTWREALQAFWFAFVFDGIDSPGRFDQYMYPYLRHSLESGEIDKDEAQRLLENLWLRFEEVRAWNLCIGGQTTAGEDATNELSYMILDIAGKYKFQAPNLTMRCHTRTPAKLWNRAAEVIAAGIGMPALYNDDVVIPALLRFGIPLEDALDYAMNGCNQIDIQGKSYMGLEDGELNLLKCLELALNNGWCRLTGELLGLETGNPLAFTRFEQVLEAYKTQVCYFTKMLTDVANKSQRAYAEYGPNPFRSLLTSDCIEKRKDFRAGGPRYNHGQILTEGIANTADSLAAVKRLVFEEDRLSMEQLLTALDSNFEGYEDIRHLLMIEGSHYGNDDEYVDEIAAEIINHFFLELMKYKTFRGGIYGGGCSTFTRAPAFGAQVGATPDGRLSGEPVADSVGPAQGRDAKGPTAVFNSVSKADHTLALSGYVLNMKFDKSVFGRPTSLEKFTALVKVFFYKGGQQVQVNVTSVDDLRAARANPDAYRSLVVRVGGFSAYFVELDPALQDDILVRTSHTL